MACCARHQRSPFSTATAPHRATPATFAALQTKTKPVSPVPEILASSRPGGPDPARRPQGPGAGRAREVLQAGLPSSPHHAGRTLRPAVWIMTTDHPAQGPRPDCMRRAMVSLADASRAEA